MQRTAKQTFWLLFGATVFVKLVIAALLPMTSDEAHFVLWGRYPGFGYFDHPPMIGWLLHVMELFGSSPALLRLPAIAFSALVGYGIYEILKKLNPAVALPAAALYLLSPINILNVIVTTDTPLFLFVFLSGSCYFLAEKQGQRMPLYALSGAFLGLAFLSKYFAVLLGLAYAVHWALAPKTKARSAGVAVLYAAALPFIGVNVAWNYYHGWPNIMFNLINRNRNEVFSLGKVLTFVACQLYLITPPVLYIAIRKRMKEGACPLLISPRDPAAVFLLVFVVPLAVFGLLSFKKVIGLHWPLSFYPFMYLIIGAYFTADELKRSARFMAYFTGAHVLLVVTLLSLPVSVARHNKNFPAIVMGMYPRELMAAISDDVRTFNLMTPSYADSALLEFHTNHHVPVFGTGSFHARHDDFITDFRIYKGLNILILRTSEPQAGEYDPYFDTVVIEPVTVRGARFWRVFGRRFNYEAYRDRVLGSIRDQFYAIPPWLPYKRSDFLEKYFTRLS